MNTPLKIVSYWDLRKKIVIDKITAQVGFNTEMICKLPHLVDGTVVFPENSTFYFLFCILKWTEVPCLS